MELRTERLILRPFCIEDQPDLVAMNADPRVMQYFVAPLSDQESATMLDLLMADPGDPSLACWAVTRRGEFLGMVNVTRPRFEAPFQPCVEIGWRFTVKAWGQGFATEAASTALDHSFSIGDLSEIVSFTALENLRSQAVMQRLGMVLDAESEFDHPSVPEGHHLRRHCLYRLSAEDWRRRHGLNRPV